MNTFVFLVAISFLLYLPHSTKSTQLDCQIVNRQFAVLSRYCILQEYTTTYFNLLLKSDIYGELKTIYIQGGVNDEIALIIYPDGNWRFVS